MRDEPPIQERGRSYPVGTEISGGVVDFRVWAPGKKKVDLVIGYPQEIVVSMQAEAGGYYRARIESMGAGVLYQFRLDGQERLLADPASRFQPEGPSGPSEVIDPMAFDWTDAGWKGIIVPNPVIYEMHVGTFTQEGTWRAAAGMLPELAKDGIDIIEVMPVAEFAGRWGWGYDGVNLFAPYHTYGRPDELRHFINEAHRLNIGVILDIVYNHLGPDGNDLGLFSKDYFTSRYTCEWGEAVNFDGPSCEHVRAFFLTNARYWIEEFHFDGFRIDATQQIFDHSEPHIIAEITTVARQAAPEKTVYITGENEPQRRLLLEPVSEGGCGLDALWNDDFHHSMRVIMTGRSEAYLSDYSGSAQEIISSAKHGCLYQGQFSRWQQNHRGTHFRGIGRRRFICYLQNHDQSANSAWGYRLSELASAAKGRAAIALLLLGPWTPMIFQGQEFNASTPFLYFADHEALLSQDVYKGRKLFLSQFPSIATEEMQNALEDPALEETFLKCKLDDNQRQGNSRFRSMFRFVTELRRSDEVLTNRELEVDGAVLGPGALVIRYFAAEGDRLLIANFGPNLLFSPAPEPLLACVENHHWVRIFSSEEPQYGGSGTPEAELLNGWRIPAECTMLFVPERTS